MTIQDLVERHHEGLHPCQVHSGAASKLVATCPACRVRLRAELLSPCISGGHDHRAILMLACPMCGRSGQLRLQRDVEVPVPSGPPGHMDVCEGRAGYLGLACSCPAGGVGIGMVLQRHRTTDEELVLEGASARCGHKVTLRLPRTDSFKVQPHTHS